MSPIVTLEFILANPMKFNLALVHRRADVTVDAIVKLVKQGIKFDPGWFFANPHITFDMFMRLLDPELFSPYPHPVEFDINRLVLNKPVTPEFVKQHLWRFTEVECIGIIRHTPTQEMIDILWPDGIGAAVVNLMMSPVVQEDVVARYKDRVKIINCQSLRPEAIIRLGLKRKQITNIELNPYISVSDLASIGWKHPPGYFVSNVNVRMLDICLHFGTVVGLLGKNITAESFSLNGPFGDYKHVIASKIEYDLIPEYSIEPLDWFLANVQKNLVSSTT